MSDEHSLADYELIVSRLEIAIARYESALDAVHELLGIIRRGNGYMPASDQKTMWRATALLADAGRRT
jgi:hypothetical protein